VQVGDAQEFDACTHKGISDRWISGNPNSVILIEAKNLLFSEVKMQIPPPEPAPGVAERASE
jgi:hypothetical protein